MMTLMDATAATDAEDPTAALPTPAWAAARADALRYLPHWIAYRAWKLEVPGVQFAVFADDRITSGAVGVADLDTGEALREDHRFRVASHSKWFTSTAVLRLAASGALRLDDPVGRLAPVLARTAIAERTVGELLSHAGGVIRDAEQADFWQFDGAYPDADGLAAILAGGAVAEQWTAFKYSNAGYAALGAVIEAVTGRGYAEHLRADLLAPLGLDDEIAPEFDPTGAGPFATGHSGRYLDRERRTLPHVQTRAFAPATGFTATARAMVRFASAHFDAGAAGVLEAAARRRQRHPVWASRPEEPATGRYAHGLQVDAIGGRDRYGHSGGFPGFITRTFFEPADRIAVSVLTNAIDGPATELATGAVRLLDAAGEPAKHPHAAGVDLDRCTGRFASLWGILDLVRIGDRLLAISPSQADPIAGADELRALDQDTLRIERGDGFGAVGELLHLDRDGEGRIAAVRGGGGITRRPIGHGHDLGAGAPGWPIQ